MKVFGVQAKPVSLDQVSDLKIAGRLIDSFGTQLGVNRNSRRYTPEWFCCRSFLAERFGLGVAIRNRPELCAAAKKTAEAYAAGRSINIASSKYLNTYLRIFNGLRFT